ncbi:hypothetical protein LPJ66_002062 [Kickxella alabastrina]|uniref:Uncharacterized protein n=1 Tax=Kickxella alabastrina TaxID=61397 RepID=A0ACC1IRK2_9FUNG|nr:hypothetical protein LPJ66_002062 [Kickxella alabastrina]
MSDNAAVLTSGSKVYAKKRKARKEQVEEIEFDPKARRTFLTGFHKRKVERRETAIEQAKQKEREELLKLRRERREQQQEALIDKLRENKSVYGGADSDSESGSDDGSGAVSGGEDEGKDEDGAETSVLTGETSVTTVKVVRDFDPRNLVEDEILLEKRLTPQGLIDKLKKDVAERARRAEADAIREKKEAEAARKSQKKKPKKFRYETKAKRAVKNSKDKESNSRRRTQRTAGSGTGKK